MVVFTEVKNVLIYITNMLPNKQQQRSWMCLPEIIDSSALTDPSTCIICPMSDASPAMATHTIPKNKPAKPSHHKMTFLSTISRIHVAVLS